MKQCFYGVSWGFNHRTPHPGLPLSVSSNSEGSCANIRFCMASAASPASILSQIKFLINVIWRIFLDLSKSSVSFPVISGIIVVFVFNCNRDIRHIALFCLLYILIWFRFSPSIFFDRFYTMKLSTVLLTAFERFLLPALMIIIAHHFDLRQALFFIFFTFCLPRPACSIRHIIKVTSVIIGYNNRFPVTLNYTYFVIICLYYYLYISDNLSTSTYMHCWFL